MSTSRSFCSSNKCSSRLYPYEKRHILTAFDTFCATKNVLVRTSLVRPLMHCPRLFSELLACQCIDAQIAFLNSVKEMQKLMLRQLGPSCV